MMVAGNHAHNDMTSDNPHSWKSIVDANNIDAQPRLKRLESIQKFNSYLLKN